MTATSKARFWMVAQPTIGLSRRLITGSPSRSSTELRRVITCSRSGISRTVTISSSRSARTFSSWPLSSRDSAITTWSTGFRASTALIAAYSPSTGTPSSVRPCRVLSSESAPITRRPASGWPWMQSIVSWANSPAPITSR